MPKVHRSGPELLRYACMQLPRPEEIEVETQDIYRHDEEQARDEPAW